MIWSVFSMSDDERESGCDTVDGSPASVSSSRADSPFLEATYINDNNQNCKANGTSETESTKLPIRTMVVPPMRVQNNEPMGRTGNQSQQVFQNTSLTNPAKISDLNKSHNHNSHNKVTIIHGHKQ